MTATLDQARVDLAPYVARLRRCIQTALTTYQAEIGQFAYRHTKRSQASLIHDYMVDAVKAEFDDEPGISFTTRRNLFTVDFFHRYLIKLKKHDRNLRTSNIPTQLVLDWLDQKQLELSGMPDEATKLHLGYQAGMTLASSKVWLTCPDGSALDWKWELVGDEPMGLPMPEVGPQPRPVRPRPVPPIGDAGVDGRNE
ncbi:MAG: hypothetical protein ACYDAK_08595 [Candidatus Limnocylindrales bacterium]